MSQRDGYRPVNQVLGSQPRFGPIPADQLLPWMGFGFASYFICDQLFRLPWIVTFGVIVWLCASWWLLTGSRSYRFLGKFMPVPNWVRGRVRYRSVMEHIRKVKQPPTRRKRR